MVSMGKFTLCHSTCANLRGDGMSMVADRTQKALEEKALEGTTTITESSYC